MQILILNQFFYPDAAATSQLLTDLARSFADQGHAVRVVCGQSVYAGEDESDPHGAPPVEVVRASGKKFVRSRAGRVLSYFSFLISAAWHSLVGPRPELVLTLTTPPGLSIIGSMLKMVSGARHFIWEMDIYPDIAVDLGVFGARSWMTGLVGLCLDASRRRADGIIALSDTMRERLIRRGMPAERIHVCHNWADGQEIRPQPFPKWRPLRILYSGNFGLSHDVDTICAAIRHFAADDRYHFVFSGGGSQRIHVDRFCMEVGATNTSFPDYTPRRELSGSLGLSHIGLVTQKAVTLGAVVPSKTYGIMAAGRPVLYVGPKEGTPAQIVRQFQCGWQVDPGDSSALIDLLERLAANPAEVAEAGARGREAFLRNYDMRIAVARIWSILGLEQREAVETALLAHKEQRS